MAKSLSISLRFPVSFLALELLWLLLLLLISAFSLLQAPACTMNVLTKLDKKFADFYTSTSPSLFKQSFTNLTASIVSSLVIYPWIFRTCLLTENPLSGSYHFSRCWLKLLFETIWLTMGRSLMRQADAATRAETFVLNCFFPFQFI